MGTRLKTLEDTTLSPVVLRQEVAGPPPEPPAGPLDRRLLRPTLGPLTDVRSSQPPRKPLGVVTYRPPPHPPGHLQYQEISRRSGVLLATC